MANPETSVGPKPCSDAAEMDSNQGVGNRADAAEMDPGDGVGNHADAAEMDPNQGVGNHADAADVDPGEGAGKNADAEEMDSNEGDGMSADAEWMDCYEGVGNYYDDDDDESDSSTSITETIVILDKPPPKKIAFGKITEESRTAQLKRTPFTRFFQHGQRAWLKAKLEKEAILRSAKEEAEKLKKDIEKDDIDLRNTDKRLLDLEKELEDLQKQVNRMENLPIDITFRIDFSIRSLQTEPAYRFPADPLLLKMIEEETLTLDVEQRRTLRSILKKIKAIERVKREKKILLREKKQHTDSLNNAYFRMKMAQKAHKELLGYVGQHVGCEQSTSEDVDSSD